MKNRVPAKFTNRVPVALTIAGSDSGAGAGAQADLLTFAALGVWGTTAFTALTAQNPDRVAAIHRVPAKFLRQQLETVAEFYKISAMKTGMLGGVPAISTIAAFAKKNPQIALVVDPVMIATSGARLFDGNALSALEKKLFPRATLITPNLDEAEVLAGTPFARDLDSLVAVAGDLSQKFGTAILLKGGHASDGNASAGTQIHDILVERSGELSIFSHERVPAVNTHGSGCTLSSAIAAHLALGHDLRDSVQGAIEYLQATLLEPICVAGQNFIAHLR